MLFTHHARGYLLRGPSLLNLDEFRLFTSHRILDSMTRLWGMCFRDTGKEVLPRVIHSKPRVSKQSSISGAPQPHKYRLDSVTLWPLSLLAVDGIVAAWHLLGFPKALYTFHPTWGTGRRREDMERF